MFGNLLWFSCALSGTSYTVISQLWQPGNMDALRVVVRRNLLMSLFAVALGGSWICAEGHAIVSIWLGEQYFAGHALFLVMWLGMIIQSAQDAALVACRAAGLEFLRYFECLLCCTQTSWISLPFVVDTIAPAFVSRSLWILFAICLWWVVIRVHDRRQILRAMRRIARLPRSTCPAVK